MPFRNNINSYRALEPGDIFAVKGSGIFSRAVRNLFSPATDRFHFGILWMELPGNDFVILESLSSKGLCVGKLSWYEDRDVEFYRVNCPADLRYAAPNALVDWGRSKYDCWLIVKIIFGSVAAWMKILFTEWKIRRLRPEDLPYTKNSALLCTEAPDVGYDAVGVNVIPLGATPIPNAYKQAEMDNRMTRVVKWSE